MNKKYIEIGKNLSAVESLRGGQNSFNLENENVIEDIPSESWKGRVKEIVLADYSDENRIYADRSNFLSKEGG